MEELGPGALAVLDALFDRELALEPVRASLIAAAACLVGGWRGGGSLFLCGNGGSHADACHIAGELVKSYVLARPLPAARQAALAGLPGGGSLARDLQAGVPAVVLGANAAATSAIENDLPRPGLGLAQELNALGRSGDVLLAISTSGRSRNVVDAAVVARSLGMAVVALTGTGPSELADVADVVIAAPGGSTDRIQESHRLLYHALCEALEVELFGV